MSEVATAWFNAILAILNLAFAAYDPNHSMFVLHLAVGLLNTFCFLHYINKGVV